MFGLGKTLPAYVLRTLSLGPINTALDQFDPNDVLVKLHRLIDHCKQSYITDDTITVIIVKMPMHSKNCYEMKSSQNIQMTKK